MGRQQSRYVCQACGAAHIRWEGQCRTCGAWNTLVETLLHEPDQKRRSAGAASALRGETPAPQSLNSLREAEPVRTPTGISELDRVLGGAWFRDRSCCSAANLGSANPRCCSRRRPAWRRDGRPRSSTPPGRSRPGRCACEPAGWGCSMALPGSGSGSWQRTRSVASPFSLGRRVPALSSSTRSRPSRWRSSKARPVRSARSASAL